MQGKRNINGRKLNKALPFFIFLAMIPGLVSAGTITYRTKYISGDWTTYIYRYDASTDSFSSNLKYSSTYDYFDDNATVGDILYLGRSNVHSAFDGLVFYIGTAMSGTGITIVPEYYNGSDWVTVVDYRDDTEQFTATGERIFQFDPTKQTGWSSVNVNGATKVWIRFRISALDTITEGGAQSTQYTKWRSDRIWVEDYASSTPATTDDIYNADKNGTFDLLEETSPATGLVPTYSLRPTDELAITVDVTLSSDTDAGSGDTVDVHGTDIDGASLTESINVSAGAGTYTTVNKFSSISSIDCNGFSNGTVKITQNQWGVVWKKDNWYRFDKGLYFSNTYFADSGKQYYINIKNWQIMSATVWLGAEGSNITFGELVDETSKSTKNGVSILFDNKADQYIIVMETSGGSVKLYSCYLSCINRNDALVAAKGTADANNRVWNTVFTDGVAFSQTVYTNIFNLNVISTSAIVRRPVTTATVERVYGNYVSYGAWFQNTEDGYIKDIFGRNMGYAAFMESEYDYNCSLVNGDFDAWKVRWSGTNNLARLYRKYTVNIKVIDKDGNPIEGANVTLNDVDGTEVFSATTDSNGEIPEQEVSRGYCQYPDDNLETNLTKDYSPHTLTISHRDHPSREFKFTLNEKIDWTIALSDAPQNSGTVIVHGTEYAPDEEGVVYAQVLYGDGSPANSSANCNITRFNKDSIWVSQQNMTYIPGSDGGFYYNFTVPSNISVFMTNVKCSNPTAYGSSDFHVSTATDRIISYLEEINSTTHTTHSYLTGTISSQLNRIERNVSYIRENMSNASALSSMQIDVTWLVNNTATQNNYTDLKSYGDTNWITATGFSTHSAADVWNYTTRQLSSPICTDSNQNMTGIIGAKTECPTNASIYNYFTYGDNEDAFKATGFSTHSAADVWTVADRELSTPDNYKADVSGLSTQENITDLKTHGDTYWNATELSDIASEVWNFNISTNIQARDALYAIYEVTILTGYVAQPLALPNYYKVLEGAYKYCDKYVRSIEN